MAAFEITEFTLKKLEEQLFKYEMKLLRQLMGREFAGEELKNTLKELNFEDKIINLILDQSEVPGSIIKRKREASGLSLLNMAILLNISESELLKVENNEEKKPSLELLVSMARILEFSKYETSGIVFRVGYDEKALQEVEKILSSGKVISEKTIHKESFEEKPEGVFPLKNGSKVTVKQEEKKFFPRTGVETRKMTNFSDQIKLIPILEGASATTFPNISPGAATNQYLTLAESYKIPVDFILRAKDNSMIEFGITAGMLCFVKKQSICNSEDIVLLSFYQEDKPEILLRKARIIQNNIIIYQDGRGNILGIPAGGKVEILGIVTFKQDDPIIFS